MIRLLKACSYKALLELEAWLVCWHWLTHNQSCHYMHASFLAGMLGYVVLLEHLQRLMYLYHVFTILQTVSIVLLLVTFWRKW